MGGLWACVDYLLCLPILVSVHMYVCLSFSAYLQVGCGTVLASVGLCLTIFGLRILFLGADPFPCDLYRLHCFCPHLSRCWSFSLVSLRPVVSPVLRFLRPCLSHPCGPFPCPLFLFLGCFWLCPFLACLFPSFRTIAWASSLFGSGVVFSDVPVCLGIWS